MKRVAAACAIALSLGAEACGASASDSPRDAAIEASSDAGSGDARDAADAAETSAPCAPGDVTSFTPSFHSPSGAHQAKCTFAQIDAFYTACLADTATKATCAPFGLDGGVVDHACAACLVSKSSDPTLGPVVVYPLSAGSAVEIDFAGCVALVDPSATPCAKAYQAGVECEHAACDTACRGDDSASFDQYEGCRGAANVGECSAYTKAGQCVQALGDAGASDGGDATSRCLFAGTTFEELYRAIAPLFCGP
jgi:hypothetical protein